MKTPLLLILMLLFMSSTLQWGLIRTVVTTRFGVIYTNIGSGDGSEKYMYRFYGNNTVSVTTSATTQLTSHFNLTAIPLTESNTENFSYWLMVIGSYTGYQGNEEIPFNNSDIQHQPVFHLTQDAKTGEALSLNISSDLDPKYLRIVRDVIKKHWTPNITDPSKLLLSSKTTDDDNLMVITNNAPEDGNVTGSHSIALNSEGFIQESKAQFRIRFKGEIKFRGVIRLRGEEANELSSSVELGTEYNFFLQEKVKQDPELVDLAKKTLSTDSTIKSYLREQFFTLVDGLTLSDSVETNSLSLEESLPNLRADDSENSNRRGDGTSYGVHQKRYSIMESWFFGKLFQVEMETNITLIIKDSDTDGIYNKYQVSTRLMMKYGQVYTWIPVHNYTNYLTNGYKKEKRMRAYWEMRVPVEYSDDRINFDLMARINLTIDSRDEMKRVGNQLLFSRGLTVKSNCNATRLVDGTTIQGFASITGRLAHFKAEQQTFIVLRRNEVKVNDALVPTVLPLSYNVVQKYRTFDCWKSQRKLRQKQAFCIWNILEDKQIQINAEVKQKIVTVNSIKLT